MPACCATTAAKFLIPHEERRRGSSTSAWASTQETRDEPKSSTHNQGVERPGGTTQWNLSLARSLALSLSLVLSQKRKVSIILRKTLDLPVDKLPYLCCLSHAFTFHTLNSCPAALCHAASFKRLWCPYPCMGRGVSAKRENKRYSHIVDQPSGDCPCLINTQWETISLSQSLSRSLALSVSLARSLSLFVLSISLCSLSLSVLSLSLFHWFSPFVFLVPE